ncbi:MAG: hypothetical protein ACTSO9_13690 [Candidatus Helarchaeota archaeon]
MVQIDFFAVLGIIIMTILFIFQLLLLIYNYKLYKLGKYRDLWKYWGYQLFGFILLMMGLAIAFYFYVLYIFSRPTLALRITADPIHLFFIYMGAMTSMLGSILSVLGIRVFYSNAEKMSKKEMKK